MLVQRDDRGDRAERQLEARAGQRLGPGDEHRNRAGGDEPQRHRLAPDRESSEDEQRRDAAADRRHLGAGQQRIADRRRSPRRARDERQTDAQRQRGEQREQPQRDHHRRADHRGDVQPADRQEVREPRDAHRFRILLGDRADVARRQCRGDAAGAARQRVGDMRGEARAKPRPLPARPNDLNRREAATGGAHAREPGDPRIVVGTGHGGTGRRHQAGAQPDTCAGDHARRHVRLGKIDAHSPGQRDRPPPPVHARTRRQQGQPHQLARRERLHPLDLRHERRHHWPRKHGRGDALGPPPHAREPRGGEQRADADRARRPPAPARRHAGEPRRRERQHRSQPRARPRQREPCGGAGAEHHRYPQRQLVPFRLQPALDRVPHAIDRRELSRPGLHARGRCG